MHLRWLAGGSSLLGCYGGVTGRYRRGDALGQVFCGLWIAETFSGKLLQWIGCAGRSTRTVCNLNLGLLFDIEGVAPGVEFAERDLQGTGTDTVVAVLEMSTAKSLLTLVSGSSNLSLNQLAILSGVTPRASLAGHKPAGLLGQRDIAAEHTM
jgi:hypothetical protein